MTDCKFAKSMRWGQQKLSSLLTEGYHVVSDFTETSPREICAVLSHRNGNRIVIFVYSDYACVTKNHKIINVERF